MEEILCIHKPRKCPKCGGKVARIFYGLPAYTEKLQADLDAGRVILGGCCRTEHDPTWQCTKCGQEFYQVPAGIVHDEIPHIPPLRYTLEAQKLADACAKENFGNYGCDSALYDGTLDWLPKTLIFSPLFEDGGPDIGFPPFILVENGEADLHMSMEILDALMKKYHWPDEFDTEDGYVPPTQIARFYQVKDEVEAQAVKSLESQGKFPYYPNVWPEMKRIFRTQYHIQWKAPDEIFKHRIYD
ncbi:MAG: hypothetical protein MJZ65_04460 [Paludibacteraceae bacterium]|nr:hypothetical protein [Paludibacteraceae bacterium]